MRSGRIAGILGKFDSQARPQESLAPFGSGVARNSMGFMAGEFADASCRGLLEFLASGVVEFTVDPKFHLLLK